MLAPRYLLIPALVLAWAAPARAQWVAAPYLGVNVAGDLEERRGGPGGAIAYLGGRLGFELDFQRYHHFFDDTHVDNPDPSGAPNCVPGLAGGPRGGPCVDINTDAMGFMGNVVVRPGVGIAARWRPYGVAGLGVIHAWLEHPQDAYDCAQNDVAFDLGGGTIYALTARVGLRGDVRYLRALVDENETEGAYFEDYGFWRVTLGVAIGSPR